ncbi:TPA: DoxX family protein [Serratia odorifera]
MLNSKNYFLTLCLSRVVVTFFFWMAGIFGVFNFDVIVEEMVVVGLPWPVLFAVGTILCQLVGSALIIFNVAGLGWVGSVMLIVFTLLTIPLGHPFWAFSEPERTKEFHIVLEHITVVGGLMMSAILSGHKR